MSTDKERIQGLETHLPYIKEKLDNIDKKVDDLVGWKFRIMGGASVIAAIVAYLVAVLSG